MAVEKQIIDPGWGWNEPFLFSQAIRAGDFIFVSGQGPVALGTTDVVGGDDFLAQARQVMENIKAVLAAAGATMDDLVETVVYVTDISELPLIIEAVREYYPTRCPASTAVAVSALAFPGQKLEIRATAIARSSAT